MESGERPDRMRLWRMLYRGKRLPAISVTAQACREHPPYGHPRFQR
ncbi:hypothetical protein BRAS3809_1730007 [Bradyrhizobium sp. STM 3809]|nr:hypothetical protein BRAS3809_1730007 [Bradyrhizobium sp. STM 3809]